MVAAAAPRRCSYALPVPRHAPSSLSSRRSVRKRASGTCMEQQPAQQGLVPAVPQERGTTLQLMHDCTSVADSRLAASLPLPPSVLRARALECSRLHRRNGKRACPAPYGACMFQQHRLACFSKHRRKGHAKCAGRPGLLCAAQLARTTATARRITMPPSRRRRRCGCARAAGAAPQRVERPPPACADLACQSHTSKNLQQGRALSATVCTYTAHTPPPPHRHTHTQTHPPTQTQQPLRRPGGRAAQPPAGCRSRRAPSDRCCLTRWRRTWP